MCRISKKILLILLCVSAVLSARIIETTEISEIGHSIEGNTWVIFDLDDTLMDSVSTLNSGAWIKFYWKTGLTLFPNDEPLLEELLRFMNVHVPVKAVEACTPQMITELQKRVGVLVWALTARCARDELLTIQQLSSIGIQFAEGRMLFTTCEAKGAHLQKLIDDNPPQKVVFVDDRLDHVKCVENAMLECAMPCDAYWYRRAEKERPPFNPLIALIQLEHLLNHQQVLRDTEAYALEHLYEDIPLNTFFQTLIEHFASSRYL